MIPSIVWSLLGKQKISHHSLDTLRDLKVPWVNTDDFQMTKNLWNTLWSQDTVRTKRVPNTLQLELKIVVSHHVDAGNRTCVLCKCGQCSYLQNYLSSSLPQLFFETSLHIGLGLATQARQAHPWLCFPSTQTASSLSCLAFLHGVLGTELRSSCLHSKHFTNQTISSVPFSRKKFIAFAAFIFAKWFPPCPSLSTKQALYSTN